MTRPLSILLGVSLALIALGCDSIARAKRLSSDAASSTEVLEARLHVPARVSVMMKTDSTVVVVNVGEVTLSDSELRSIIEPSIQNQFRDHVDSVVEVVAGR